MVEPGLDKHEWESQWQQFEEDLESSPAEALPEVDQLIYEMLEARGYAIDDPVVSEGDDREIVAEFLAAHEITQQINNDEEVDPGDVAAAVEGYRSLYEYLIEERAPP
jgi:hypothetical protein